MLINPHPAAEKDRQKAEKAKKLAEKQAKKHAGIAATPKAAKIPNHADELSKYVEQTPEGEKKSWQSSSLHCFCPSLSCFDFSPRIA